MSDRTIILVYLKRVLVDLETFVYLKAFPFLFKDVSLCIEHRFLVYRETKPLMLIQILLFLETASGL